MQSFVKQIRPHVIEENHTGTGSIFFINHREVIPAGLLKDRNEISQEQIRVHGVEILVKNVPDVHVMQQVAVRPSPDQVALADHIPGVDRADFKERTDDHGAACRKHQWEDHRIPTG